MSYYETPAEKPYYIHFQKRTVDDTLGHFHSGMELIIVKSGSLVAVTGAKRERSARATCVFRTVSACTAIRARKI